MESTFALYEDFSQDMTVELLTQVKAKFTEG